MPRLGLRKDDPTSFDWAYRGAYLYLAPLQVYVVLLERQQLAKAHPRRDRQHVEGLPPISLRGTEELADLLLIEHLHLVMSGLRCRHRLTDVVRDEMFAHSVLEQALQDHVHVTNRGT